MNRLFQVIQSICGRYDEPFSNCSIGKAVIYVPDKASDVTEKEWLLLVKQMVSEIKYGTISIVVQDGKIVQIEQNKKIRL